MQTIKFEAGILIAPTMKNRLYRRSLSFQSRVSIEKRGGVLSSPYLVRVEGPDERECCAELRRVLVECVREEREQQAELKEKRAEESLASFAAFLFIVVVAVAIVFVHHFLP